MVRAFDFLHHTVVFVQQDVAMVDPSADKIVEAGSEDNPASATRTVPTSPGAIIATCLGADARRLQSYVYRLWLPSYETHRDL